MMGDNNKSFAIGVSSLLRLDWNRFTVPINGFLMPLITAVTVVNNMIVLAVLLHRQMRSPTNALLAALAVSDTLMSVCPMPCFIHFYTIGQRYLDWVPYSWCFAYFCLTDYLPTVFHTASIWLTTSLAVQRYACVCCSVNSKVRQWLCSMRGAVCVVVGVYTAAVASQACQLGEFTFRAVKVPSLINTTHPVNEDDGGTSPVEVTACQYELTPFVARYETIYFNVYYWSRVILIHVIPCSALVVLNACLIRVMRAARQHRRRMSERTTVVFENESPAPNYRMQILASLPDAPATNKVQSSAVASSLSRQRRCSTGTTGTKFDLSMRSTMMLIIVVGVFLLVEVPLSSIGRPQRTVAVRALKSRRGSAAVCATPTCYHREYIPRGSLQRRDTLHGRTVCQLLHRNHVSSELLCLLCHERAVPPHVPRSVQSSGELQQRAAISACSRCPQSCKNERMNE